MIFSSRTYELYKVAGIYQKQDITYRMIFGDLMQINRDKEKTTVQRDGRSFLCTEGINIYLIKLQ